MGTLYPLLTQVAHIEPGVEVVLPAQVLLRPLTAVVLDIGEGSCPQNVVVDTVHLPVKVRQAELVVFHCRVPERTYNWIPYRQAYISSITKLRFLTRICVFKNAI